MRFAFTEEQQLFRGAVRDVLQRECPPERVRESWALEAGRSPGLWGRLAELGVVGLTVPEVYGGLGMNELDLVLLLEETGRVVLPEPIVETTAVAAPLLNEVESQALKARWLPAIASGDAIVTVGLERSPFVVDAHVADLLILQHGDELHAVERDAVRLEPQTSVDGSRRLFRLSWNPGLRTRITEGEAGRRTIDAAFDRGALAVSAQLLGIARQQIDMTVAYVKVREQFGKPIGSFQAVKHHLANALLKLEFAAPVVYRAAWSVANGVDDRSMHVSMARAYASDAALLASKAALQCHGAIGYAFEHDLHLWMKRGWALAAAWGDAGWHRARVGVSILGAHPSTSGGL